MLPLNSNDPYIDDSGKRSRLGDVIGGGGGSSDLPSHTIADAGKSLMVDDDGNLEWGTTLPEYGAGDAGKVLSVNNSGELNWTLPTSRPNRYEAINVVEINNNIETSAEEVTS